MAKSRRSYKGAAVSNTVAGGGLSAGATTITLGSAVSGWPTGAEPFFVVIDAGTSKEEKVCVKYATSTSLTVVDPAVTSGWSASANGRGADDTTDRAHDAGAVIYPVFTAREANDANELTSAYTANGDLVVHGSTSFKKIAVGTNAYVLQADSSVTDGGVKWGQVATAGIADSAVTSAKIADGTIVAGDVASAFKKLVCPVGTITAFGGASAPTGWLLCNGSAIDAAYTELIALVGANTPDMKGRFPLGDNASLDLLATGGSTTIGTTNLPAHSHSFSATSGPMSANSSLSHTITDNGHSHNINGARTQNENSINGNSTIDVDSDWGLASSATEATASATTGISISAHTVSHTHDVSGTTGSTGGAAAYYQPYLVVNFIIKHDY